MKIRELKERPSERPITGDLVVLRHHGSIYKPARLIKIERRNRHKVYATIQWKSHYSRYYKGNYPERIVSYYDLVLVRRDTLLESVVNSFTNIIKYVKRNRNSSN